MKKYTFQLKKESPARLDHWIFSELERVADFRVTRSLVRKWILAGKLKLVGSSIRLPTRFSRPGEKFTLELADGDLPSPETTNADVQVEIIYRDEFILAAAKPPGLPSQPTLDPMRPNLFTWLKKTQNLTYLGQHHRLDRDTSGVIVFTVSERANKGLADAFKEREAQKTYYAIIESRGQPLPKAGASFEVRNFLKRGEGKAARMRSVRSGGDPAETQFRVIASFGDRALVEAMPKTGRMHQIRVHLSELGFPIVGDRDYGAKSEGRTMLHALRLTLNHPVSNVELTIEAPLPKDFLACLKASRIAVPAADLPRLKPGTASS